MQTILNYIHGEFVPAAKKNILHTINPATGETYASLPNSDQEDVEAAVGAARAAAPLWQALPASRRAQYLNAIADALEANLGNLAKAETDDNGKPLQLARTVDIPRSILNFRFFAAAATQFASESHAGPGTINYTLRQPLGVVGCISPWNLPLYLFTWKVAPALAAGNCVVAKPSEITPMTAYLLAKICDEVNLPKGVLNIVHGTGPQVGAALVSHPGVNAISFTGGTETGAAIAKATAPHFKKVSLELGGKNPALIFADCNYDRMLNTVVRSAFTNQGQICLCSSRLYIEEPLYERVKGDLVKHAKNLRIGDPLDPATEQGAIVSKEHYEKVLGHTKAAQGKLLCGGKPRELTGRCAAGYFIEPTVLEGLPLDSPINQTEVFGPVITLTPFKSDDEALNYANGTRYGLAATVWTEDLSRAHRLVAGIEAGVVWVNTWMNRDLRTPFGGMKDSGLGREGGFEALRFFTNTKNICIEY